MQRLLFFSIVLAALGSGLMGGFFFAFPNTVVTALGRLPPRDGIAAMQAMNVAVANELFFVIFFGTPLLCALLAIAALVNLGTAGSYWVCTGSLVYVLGVFVVTVVVNVPMNDALAAIDPAPAAGADVWRDYLVRWTAWNHVRALAGIAACVAFILALPESSLPFTIQ